MPKSVYKIRGAFYPSKLKIMLLIFYPMKTFVADGVVVNYKIMRGKTYFMGLQIGGDAG
jgi:hypothetical protein